MTCVNGKVNFLTNRFKIGYNLLVLDAFFWQIKIIFVSLQAFN